MPYISGQVSNKGVDEVSLKFIILQFYINLQGLVPLDTLVMIELTRCVLIYIVQKDLKLWDIVYRRREDGKKEAI